MNIAKYFQKIKWQMLAKKDPNYFIFSEKDVSQNESAYQKSGQADFEKLFLKDNLLADFLKDREAKKCLELGCGNGRMTQFFAQQFNQVWALDISCQMLALAKKRLLAYKNIFYLETDGTEINMPDNSVDFIFSYAVLQHFPTKQMIKKTLAEFFRVLNNKGIAKIQVRGLSACGGILKYFKWYYGVFFFKQEISRILNETGFKIIDIKGDNTKLLWLWLKK